MTFWDFANVHPWFTLAYVWIIGVIIENVSANTVIWRNKGE